MKESYNVLIVPAGSGMAIAAIKALKKDPKMRVFTADTNKLASGLYISDKGFIVPSFSDPSFYPTLRKLISDNKIDVIIPALDTILKDFSERKKEFDALGAKVLVSEPEIINITRDKWNTYNELKDVVPFPQAFIDKEDIDIKYPLLMKPRGGSGSIDVHKLISKEELDFFYERVQKPIIQEYLPGKEYTVDCLSDAEGNLLLCVPRERIETKAGISVKGKVVKNEFLQELAKKISNHLTFCGPFFFQAKEDVDGVPKIIEINPRISGTMSLSSSSGPNMHSFSVRSIMGEPVEIPEINYGLYITRYWEEIYLTEEDMQNGLNNDYC